MSVIKLKRSSVAGHVPASSSLQDGEVALNTADGLLFFKQSSTTTSTVVQLSPLFVNSGTNYIRNIVFDPTSGFTATILDAGSILIQNTLIGTSSGSSNLNVNGTPNVSSITFDTTYFTVTDLGGGAIQIVSNSSGFAGGTTGNTVNVNNPTASTGTSSGAITTPGGVGIGGDVNIGGNTTIAGNLTVTGTINANVPQTLVWTTSGNTRILTGYNDENGLSGIRNTAFFTNGSSVQLKLTLSSFTPTLTAVGIPSSSLNFDDFCYGFTVNASNPTDYYSKWITDVNALNVTSGFFSPLANFAPTSPSPTPAAGVNWSQSFYGYTAYIRSTSTNITGGTASASIQFDYSDGSNTYLYTGGVATLNITWATPTLSVSVGGLSGKTFLSTYTSTNYTTSYTGMSNSSNVRNNLTAVGGTLSSTNSNGIFTFTNPIHKNNVSDTRTINNNAGFNRPAPVTGTPYIAYISQTTSNPSVTFTFPSFWVFTSSVTNPPSRTDIVTGTNFQSSVTLLADQIHTFGTIVNNTAGIPQGFWFGVRTSATQPTAFKTGASSSLLSDVAHTSTTVTLYPDSVPSGYVGESYTLYGITLQANNTYVSIG